MKAATSPPLSSPPRFRNAVVRGALGSLVDACLATLDGRLPQIKGRAVEIVGLAGEVQWNSDGSVGASLSGVVADTEGNRYGGSFVAGANPICMTFELTPEEWLPETRPIRDGA